MISRTYVLTILMLISAKVALGTRFTAPPEKSKLEILTTRWQDHRYETYTGVSYDNPWAQTPKRPSKNTTFELSYSRHFFSSKVHSFGFRGQGYLLDTTRTTGQAEGQSPFKKSTFTFGYSGGIEAATLYRKVSFSAGLMLGNFFTRQSYQANKTGTLLAYAWNSMIDIRIGTLIQEQKKIYLGAFLRRLRTSKFQTVASSGVYGDLQTGDLIQIRNGTSRDDLRIQNISIGLVLSFFLDSQKNSPHANSRTEDINESSDPAPPDLNSDEEARNYMNSIDY